MIFLLLFTSTLLATPLIPIPSLPFFPVDCHAHISEDVCVNNCACVWFPEEDYCVSYNQRKEPYQTMAACGFNDLLLTLFGMIIFLIAFVVVASVVCMLIGCLLCGCKCRKKKTRRQEFEDAGNLLEMKKIPRAKSAYRQSLERKHNWDKEI